VWPHIGDIPKDVPCRLQDIFAMLSIYTTGFQILLSPGEYCIGIAFNNTAQYFNNIFRFSSSLTHQCNGFLEMYGKTQLPILPNV
jgi:hypothetical protein